MRSAGKIKVLGVASTLRARTDLGDVPTLEEQGFKNAESGSWYGLMGPRGMPEEVRQKLVSAVAKVLAMPDIREKIAATGLDPVAMTGVEFQDYLRQQWETVGKVIKSKQISLND